jgi:Na+/proline symporter
MMGVSKLDFAILVAYFVVVAVIGIVSSRLIRDREDFLMGGRRFGKIMMIFFSFGAGTHADTAVGVAGQSYRYGLAGIWYQFVMVFTLPIYWLLSPIFRRARVQTTADFFERRFGAPFMYTYAAFAVFICVAFTSVGLYGTAKLIESLTDKHVPWYWGIIAIASVSFLYGTLGGLIAAVWNDFFQGMLTIVMSLLILPFFWSHIGGSEGFRKALPDPQKAFQLVLQSDITLFWIIMMSVNSILSMVVQPHIMANAGAGKTELDSRVGFIGGMILKRLMTIPWALTGVMAIAMSQRVYRPDAGVRVGFDHGQLRHLDACRRRHLHQQHPQTADIQVGERKEPRHGRALCGGWVCHRLHGGGLWVRRRGRCITIHL